MARVRLACPPRYPGRVMRSKQGLRTHSWPIFLKQVAEVLQTFLVRLPSPEFLGQGKLRGACPPTLRIPPRLFLHSDPPLPPRIFGFVAKSQTEPQENVCHLFAEYDAVQPASRVISLVAALLQNPERM